MADKAIFITGAGSGIGQATARYFASKGWFIGLADVNSQGLDETAASLPAGQFSRHIMDVRDRDQWAAALADFVSASGGKFDVLFNNAGIGTGGQCAEICEASADENVLVGPASFTILYSAIDSQPGVGVTYQAESELVVTASCA